MVVTESTAPATFIDQTGAYNHCTDNGLFCWGTDTQRFNVFNPGPGNLDYTVTYNFGPAPDLSKLFVVVVGLACDTTATINEQGNLVGEYTFGGKTDTTDYDPGDMTFSSACNHIDDKNTGWALFQLNTSDGPISNITLKFDQIPGDGVGFTLGYATGTTPEPSSLILFGSGILGLGGLLRKRFGDGGRN